MKRSASAVAAIATAAMLLTACAAPAVVNNETQTGMANPWRDCTEEEAYQYAPNCFAAPDGAENTHWSMMLPDNDQSKESEMLVQLDFDLDGISYTAREQAVGDKSGEDISGMYYEWQKSEQVTLAGWAGGNMAATVKSFDSADESARLCIWYDTETGYAYSLGTAGPDMSAVDIKAVAETIYAPAKQIGANAPEIPEECPEEASDETLTAAAEEASPNIDISGCDTFTQIVDTKLSDGMGYANEKIGDEDVLLVSSGTYDNLDGNMAAIDAAVFIYSDNAPLEAGKVCCGGTAYPLAVSDGFLYAAGNHWICKYTIKDGSLAIVKRAVVVYDENGNESYYCEASDGTEVNNYDTVKTKEMFEALFDEMGNAKVIDFSTVGGSSASALPPYEYPGPEAFYTVLYKYMIDELAEGYPEAEVTIPCPIIIAEDESNKDDIRVWGDFWVFNYDLNGDILENTSGGSYPGCIHLKSIDDGPGYEVTEMERVGDGSDYDPTAKKIFGKYYDAFVKSNEDTEGRDAIRAQIIANYAAANDLSIKAFQDYGWDPVPLPEENIDNFYSQLD